MPEGGVLRPGSPGITAAFSHDKSIAFRLIRNATGRDSAASPSGTGRSEVRSTSYQGKPALLLLTSFAGNGPAFVDTALVLEVGLAPIWEIHHFGDRRTRFDYSGATVRSESEVPDSATRRAQHTYRAPVFHFNELDALVRSVPLLPGYHATLPLYSEMDDSLEMDSLVVEGKDSSGIWNVRFADPVIIGHFAIDGSARTILRHEVDSRKGPGHLSYSFEP